MCVNKSHTIDELNISIHQQVEGVLNEMLENANTKNVIVMSFKHNFEEFLGISNINLNHLFLI